MLPQNCSAIILKYPSTTKYFPPTKKNTSKFSTNFEFSLLTKNLELINSSPVARIYKIHNNNKTYLISQNIRRCIQKCNTMFFFEGGFRLKKHKISTVYKKKFKPGPFEMKRICNTTLANFYLKLSTIRYFTTMSCFCCLPLACAWSRSVWPV